MPLLITSGFDLKTFPQPAANCGNIYYADDNITLDVSITPDEAHYKAVYGTGYFIKVTLGSPCPSSKLLRLYYRVSTNANFSNASTSLLADWTGTSGRFAFSKEMQVAKGNYFNFYFVWYVLDVDCWDEYAGYYENKIYAKYETSSGINTANFEMKIEPK